MVMSLLRYCSISRLQSKVRRCSAFFNSVVSSLEYRWTFDLNCKMSIAHHVTSQSSPAGSQTIHLESHTKILDSFKTSHLTNRVTNLVSTSSASLTHVSPAYYDISISLDLRIHLGAEICDKAAGPRLNRKLPSGYMSQTSCHLPCVL